MHDGVIRMHALSNIFLSAAALVLASSAQAAGWHTYRDPQMGFAISYPDGWRVDTAHTYTALGPGKDIHGVAFKVSKRFTTGTNLSDDSYLAVEVLPGVKDCTAADAASPFAASFRAGSSSMMRRPSVRMIRQPPEYVPAEMAPAAASFTQTGMPVWGLAQPTLISAR